MPHALRDWLAYTFYNNNHYRPPETLRRGIARDGAIESYRASFLSRLNEKVRAGTRNQLTFLVGDIGSGKSTLASHIIFKEGPTFLNTHGILPLRLDFSSRFEDTLAMDDQAERHILAWLFNRILCAFRDLAVLTDAELEQFEARYGVKWLTRELLPCQRALAHLVEGLQSKTHLGLLLVFDNLDFLYHIYDRALFVKQAGAPPHTLTPLQLDLQRKRERAFDLIHYLLKTFVKDGGDYLRHLGVNLLFVLRTDSLTHYNTTVHELAAPDLLNATFRLEVADTYDVVDAHLALFRDACTKWRTEAEGRLFDGAAQTLAPKRALKGSHRQTATHQMYQDLLALSRQGLRQFISHLGDYFWLPILIEESGESQIIVERFQTQYYPNILAFLQKGRRLYSQFTAEFPNLYLVRGEYHRDADPALENLALPHRHTYWLKRLLLEFICQRQRRREPVTPQQIYDVFCNPDDGANAYEDAIVRLCLGSMAEVGSSRLINFYFSQQAPTHRVREVSLTSRGWRLMGFLDDGKRSAPNVFADTFAYLQVILDDHILVFPRVLLDKFQYRAGLDYGYLSAPTAVYTERLIEMIKLKVQQIFIFLDILASLLSKTGRNRSTPC